MSVVNQHQHDPEHGAEKAQGAGQFQGGQQVGRAVTPGGHIVNDDLVAIGASHRKLANPLPMGAMSFATTTLVLSLYNIRVDGITVPNAVLTFSLFYGGTVQYLAGLLEFCSGNTLGATIFVCYGCFWWGFSMIFIPFFGEMGTYDGVPGVYSMTGSAAAEAESAIGLFLFVWLGITLIVTIGAARSSITLIVLLVLLDITFALLGSFYYTGNVKLETAGGAFGIATALVAYYLAFGSLLTPTISYFTLPLGSVAVKD
ncbi:hypothetical protein FA09DRAFT_328385 [Tilletiopsis washingtonensis]|uniref:FUN34-transmembrane protein n=1 Tax=Tilletiopsis washingtonensis TaxID=58919 RepID=A0A316ZEY7_9BASI|nr:hypothetical protein FA09DRAFT_328385 [Tilletiopsis washingtonensis]PWN99578.1 hypothetical protein FA09DRAFT_328385 [Tilletiopsis washingtonensis]